MIASSSTVSNEYGFINADKPNDPVTVIQPRERDLEYSVDHFGDHFFIRTNLGAKNFRMMKTSLNNTAKDHWEEVIPYRPEVLTDGFEIFRDFLVVSERANASNFLRIVNWDDKSEHYVSFDEEVYEAGIDYNPEFDSDMLRFNYSSLTTPNSVYDYHLVTKKRTLLKRQEVVGDFDPGKYQSKRLFATAADGVKIPVSIVYKKGIQLTGENPLLLYGYGSYGISMDPYFSSVRLSLLDRGFVYAIAHIRGGQELGRQWYEDGKLLKKKNTFTDFIACAELMIEQKYTSQQKLFAMGGSAGGLLMGAVINLRPDLFKGVVAAVPFVDVITTMLDETIPLTTGEYDEWGNPNNHEAYEYMKSYSPYDNVEAKKYPNILVTTGLHDSQVQYFEPAKWVAKLRELKTDQNLLLLHINMDAGHGGASGRFERYKETALEYAFFFKLLGIQE
jgi:oligopeptidase B